MHLFVPCRRRCPCIVSSSLLDLPTQAPPRAPTYYSELQANRQSETTQGVHEHVGGGGQIQPELIGAHRCRAGPVGEQTPNRSTDLNLPNSASAPFLFALEFAIM